VPDGNFQDYVSLSQDSLYHKGAQLNLGSTSASTVQILFSNSAGALALAATATGNTTVWLPSGGGTLLTNVNVSAGTTSQNLSNVVLSNSNGVSFGLNGSTITASVVAAANINLSAGTTSNLASAFTFANANGVSFGLNASTITASIATSLTNINVSAGTTSQNLSNVVFSNSNGVSFGLNGSTVTAAVSGVVQISAGTQVATSGTVVFANSNGVTFGMSGSSQITASVNTLLTNLNVSAGTTSNLLSAITLSNSNNVSFGLNASTVTASYAFNLSAGTTSNNLNLVTLSNSNNVSFGLNASTVTASYNFNVSAGTTSQNLTAVTFSNSNGISFGLNGSTLTAELAGFSSWSNGQPVTSFATSNAFLSLQPILVPYNITVSNVIQLVSLTGHSSNVSGGFTMSLVLYTITGGTAGSLSSASSASSNFTWTSGAQYSSSTGVNYLQMSVASWALTPGPYVFGVAVASANSASLTFYGNQTGNTIVSGGGTFLTNQIFDGFSASSIAAVPTSVAISNTTAYVRTGTSVNNQPWILFQGT
jgi:hypothetical protein